SFGVEHRIKEAKAHGGEYEVVNGEQFHPESRRVTAGKNNGGRIHHGDDGGDRNRKKDERKHDFTAASTNGYGREEGSVYDESPSSEHGDEEQLPYGSDGTRSEEH